MTWQVGTLILVAFVIGAGMLWYERSRPPSQIVALVAVLAALAVAGRVVLAPIPNVVATTDIVLLAGYALGPAPGFAVGALGGLISNFWLGQGVWTPWQMAAWGMTGLAGAALWRVTGGRAGRVSLAVACGLAGLLFGMWMNFQFMVGFGGEVSPERYLALQVRAIPFDVAHIAGNFIFALIAGPAMVAAIRRFRDRFEWHRVPGAVGTVLVVASAATFAFMPPTGADASSAVGKARGWLVRQQNLDGGFGVSPGSDSSVGITSRVMIGLAASGRNPLDVIRGGRDPLDFLLARAGSIDDPNELALAVLASKATGADPRRFGSRDLIAALTRQQSRDRTFGGRVNVAAFAALALRAYGVEGPASETVAWLRSAQRADGGWGISASAGSDPDSTGTVMQLLGAGDRASRAIGFLRGIQRESGGFANYSSVNAQSTGLVLQGLAALGKGPGTINRAGKTGLDFLRSLQGESGAVNYSRNSDQTPVWVTADSLVALSDQSLPVAAPPLEPVEPSGGGSTGGSGGGSSSGSPGSGGGQTSPGSTTATADPSGTGVTAPPSDPVPLDPPTVVPGPGESASIFQVPPEPPSAALLAASAAGPSPSPAAAVLIGLVTAAGLAGLTTLLVRWRRW